MDVQFSPPQVLDLNETMTGMLNMLRRLIGENIDLTWHSGNKVWQVHMDPSQIDQILANLCTNARDAIENVGEVRIETRNASFDEAFCANNPGFNAGHYVQLSVSDNGHGMDEATLSKIYEPFFSTRDLADNLLAMSPKIKTLFMSGYTADVLADKGALSEDTHFMPKPFTLKDVVKHVEAALAGGSIHSQASS